jgi:hypothetical protein
MVAAFAIVAFRGGGGVAPFVDGELFEAILEELYPGAISDIGMAMQRTSITVPVFTRILLNHAG